MRTKSKTLFWYVGLALVAGVISFATYHFGHFTIAILVVVIPVALIVNGFLADHEDNAPGGFNNPINKSSDKVTKKEKDT